MKCIDQIHDEDILSWGQTTNIASVSRITLIEANKSNSRGLNKYTRWRTNVNVVHHEYEYEYEYKYEYEYEYVTRVMNMVHESRDWWGSKYDTSSPVTSNK